MNLTPLHVGISVKDMDEALDWYQKNLGFQLVKDDGFLPPLGARVCFLQHGSFQIELFEYQAPKPLPPDRFHPNLDLQTIGTKHIAFGVPDLAALKETLCANGVEIAHEITMGQDHILFIRDCCGTLIELIQVKAPAESD